MTDIKPDPGEQVDTSAIAAPNVPPPKDRALPTEADRDAAAKQRAEQGRRAAEQAEHGQARAVGADADTTAWYVAGDAPRRRLLLLALDGATPELMLGAWRNDLRNLARLREHGAAGTLRTSLPPASFTAWQSLLTGLDAGQLGIYAATRRPNHSYAQPVAIDSQAIRRARLWETLSRQGFRVGVLGMPATTPLAALNGHLLGEQIGAGVVAAYPEAFGRRVEQWLADEPALPPTNGDEIDQQIGEAYARSDLRFRLAQRMLAREPYDCFVLFDDGLAQVQRQLWHTLDVTHLRYTAGHPFADTISAFYRFIDDQIGELLALIDEETIVAVVSACGAQALDGELALNDWLIAEGELRLHSTPAGPSLLSESLVDWAHTRAWAGPEGAIYLNLAGREPQGIVPPAQAEALLAELSRRLGALRVPLGPQANQPCLTAHLPAALYAAAEGVAPDLVALFSVPGWRTSPLVGHPQPWITCLDSPLDAACASDHGLLVLYDPLNPHAGQAIEGATIYDVLPTLLALCQATAPVRGRGRALYSD